jgi:hypothetical protein
LIIATSALDCGPMTNLHAAFIEVLNGCERLDGVELRVADE